MAVEVSPEITDPDEADKVTLVDPLKIAADEGAIDIRPKPKPETTISDIRLKNVSLDIDFLSLVAIENFSIAAGE
jgi:hypothetical protein